MKQRERICMKRGGREEERKKGKEGKGKGRAKRRQGRLTQNSILLIEIVITRSAACPVHRRDDA